MKLNDAMALESRITEKCIGLIPDDLEVRLVPKKIRWKNVLVLPSEDPTKIFYAAVSTTGTEMMSLQVAIQRTGAPTKQTVVFGKSEARAFIQALTNFILEK